VDDFIAGYEAYRENVLARHNDEISAAPEMDEKLPWFAPGTEEVSEACLTQLAHNPHFLLKSGREDMVDTYHAMLHINILPEFQRMGWGKKMILRFVESLREVAAARGVETREVIGKGVHIAAALENGKVVPFYEKCGFRVLPGGEKENTIWMVKDVE
jgi:ribosomal protein S18 acetylase RimI-like enzyme